MLRALRVLGLFLLILSAKAHGKPLKSSTQSSSTESHPLTLEEVLDSVDRHFPAILQAQSEVEQQRGLYDASRGPFDPTLAASWGKHQEGYPENELVGVKLSSQIPMTGIKADVGFDRTQGSFPIYEGDLVTGSRGRWKGGLTVPLVRDLIIDNARARRSIEGFKFEEKEEAARVIRIETYSRAAIAYWDWLARNEARSIISNLLKLAEERDVFITKRISRGDAPAIDGVDNQRIILQRRAQLLKAQQEQLNADLNLSLYLRQDSETPLRPAPERASNWLERSRIERPTDLTDLDKVVAQYPGIRKLEYEVRQLEVNQKLTFQNLFPQLDLRMEWARYDGQLPSFRPDRNEAFIGLQFSIPLFNFSPRGRNRSAEFELQGRKFELSLKKQQLRVQLDQLVSELRVAKEVIINNFGEIEASDRLAQAERKKFERGDSNLFIVNAREVDAALARLKAVESLLDFHEKDLKLRLIQNSWIRQY